MQYQTIDQNPLFFIYSSNCYLYFPSNQVSCFIWFSDSLKIEKAVTIKTKVVQIASFWFGSFGKLDKSQSLQRQVAEKNLQATFLLVLAETSLQRQESLARVSFLWLRQRKGLFIINYLLIKWLAWLFLFWIVFYNEFLARLVINYILLMKAQTRNLTTFQKIWNTGFNIRYIVIGMIEALDKNNLAKPGDSIYLLGEKMQINKQNLQQQNALLFKKFSETPWLTYRAGFPQLYHDIKGTFVTDTGWGCMIRVGQMAFAEIIKQHRQVKSQQQMKEIIELFNDFDKTKPFSIQNINKLARKQYGILPGDWYNPSQISHVLSTLHQNSLQNSNKLSFVVFNSGNLFFDQIIQLMLAGQQKIVCNCKPTVKQVICSICNKHKLSVGVIILTRIGLEYPEQKYLKVVIQMINLKSSKGMIGGRPGKALYFLGSFNGQSMIYLDPHYVQQAKTEISQIQQTYFCGSFRTCKIKTIDPSIGMCYYFRNFQDLNQFYRDIERLKTIYENEFFIWANENTPPYLSKSIRITKQIEIDQEQYQKL